MIRKKIGNNLYLKRIKAINPKNRLYKKNFPSLILRIIKYSIIAVVILHQMLFILILFFALSFNYFNPKVTSLMLYRSIVNKQKNQKIVFVPLKQIPKRVQLYVVGIEDDKFYDHVGIDPNAILRAYNINKKLGYKYSGGSTITQQLARSLLLTPEKNYTRKYLEMLTALEFELFISKQRILELYLNNIEFGKGIYGVGRASIYYYQKSFYELSLDEINKLITIIPNPRKYNPYNFFNNQRLLSRYNILNDWSS